MNETTPCDRGQDAQADLGFRSLSVDSINGKVIRQSHMPCPVTGRSADVYLHIKGTVVLDGRRAGSGAYNSTSYNF